MTYPETRRVDVVDERFGVAIHGPYRWLENDVRSDPDVRSWTLAQNSVSKSYLAGLPERAALRKRLTALFDHERFSVPEKRGEQYFLLRIAGLDNQPMLSVRNGVHEADRIVINPNEWSADGTVAFAKWTPSGDGTHLAFAMAEHGSDWHVIQVLAKRSGVGLASSGPRLRGICGSCGAGPARAGISMRW